MSKKTQQWYVLTETQLWKLVGQDTYQGAEGALEQVEKIKEAGNTPEIYHSEFNGFRIINGDDPEQFRISLKLGSGAKPFVM